MFQTGLPDHVSESLGVEARRMPCASLLLSAAAVSMSCFPSLAARLELDRAAIAAGEVWRLVSAHWVHYSFDHLFWDALAFGVLGIGCERRSRPRFLMCVTTSALAISMAVWFGLPGLRAYRGLSGIDAALLTLLFTDLWRESLHARESRQLLLQAACLAAFLCKIAFELATGSNVFVETEQSGTVAVPLAHLVGAVVGVLVGLGARVPWMPAFRPPQPPPPANGPHRPLDRIAAATGA